MKTFLFDTFNKYKRLSESLDVETTLCNRTWVVFNNSGEKEIYIFQAKGKLLISLNGKVTHATWEYIPVNKSLIISGNNQSYMVHAAYVDNILFALNIDGTNEYAFLIDENNKQNFQPQSYNDIKYYFQAKERIQIEYEKQKQIKEEKNKELGQLRDKEYQQRVELVCKASSIKSVSDKFIIFLYILFFFTSLGFTFIMCNLSSGLGFIIFWGLIGVPFIMFGIPLLIIQLIKNNKAKRWKETHPNDPVNEYL